MKTTSSAVCQCTYSESHGLNVKVAAMAEDISETPQPPIRHHPSFYFALLFLVGPVWIVIPLSWLNVIYGLSHCRLLSYSLTGKALFAGALLEVLFNVYYYTLIRQVSWSPPSKPPANMTELLDGFKRSLQSGLASLLDDGGAAEYTFEDSPVRSEQVIEELDFDDHRAIDFRNRIRTWFGKVPWSQIRLGHIHSWLYWTTFNAALPPHTEIPKSHRSLIDEAVMLLEKRVGCTIPTGANPKVTPMLLTVDPLKVNSRPLVWYVCVKIANICLRKYYAMFRGLRCGRFKDLEYLIYEPPGYSRQDGPDPVIILHGLGLGVVQYQQVLSHFLSELPDTPLLIPIQPQISQDIFHHRYLKPMLHHEKVAHLSGLLQQLGWVGSGNKGDTLGVTLVSHSNGSYLHAWILKSFPECVKRSCFVDPVTFCSWEGDVCYNFVYKPCSTGFELVIRYFVGTELGVANLLQRHFDWLSNGLWIEEVPDSRDPQRSMFILSGKDSIVDAERVKRYLTSHGVRKGIWFDPNGRHGEGMIVGGEGMRRVMEWIKDTPPRTS